MKYLLSCFGVLLLASAIVSQSEIPEDGHCIWYGQGHINPQKSGGLLLNIAYEGPAIKLNAPSNTIQGLETHCPSLVEDILEEYDGELYTCCDQPMIDTMVSQFSALNSILASCPACMTNIKKNFCYFNCHPRQSNFLIPTAIYSPAENETTDVFAIDYYISERYTSTTFESCKNVYYATANMDAIVVLCGPYGSNCNHFNLFSYLGNNVYAPFNITYTWSDNTTLAEDAYSHETWTMTPFDQDTNPCNSSDPLMHCFCSDCAESCSEVPDLIPEKNWPYVGNMDAVVFAMILVYSALAITIVTTACCCWPGEDDPEFDSCSCTCSEYITANVEKGIRAAFTSYGTVVARHPFIFLLFGAMLVVSLGIGVTKLQVTTDPVELWAAPSSRSRLDKDYFDQHFGPFYRTTQLIIRPKGYEAANITMEMDSFNQTYTFGPALNETFVLKVLQLQNEITQLMGIYKDENVTLNDVCVKPMAPQFDECLIQSVPNYFQNDEDHILSLIESDQYHQKLVTCFGNPTNLVYPNCMGTYGGPIFPYTALGGYLEEGEAISKSPNYTEATALVVNILLINHLDKADLGPALAWEERFLKFMKSRTQDPDIYDHMDIAYNAERGIEDELKRESKNDIATILISYFIMFVYITISLGNLSADCNRLFIESKIIVGLGGVTLVMLSVFASLGFYGYIGVPSTLIVIEVIPFLVLAVGVDNIFILVQTWQREPMKENESVEEHVGRVVGIVAPSMFLSVAAEGLCFFLGALSDMPAVYSFALYAGLALVIDFILQMTCFVALMSLDATRISENRYDVIWCCKGPKKKNKKREDSGTCYDIFKEIYAPFLMKDVVRVVVLLGFLGFFCTCLAVTPHLDVGLEQDLSMPEDSFVLKWFEFLNDYLSVGAPVYFVVKDGYNYTDVDEQNLICQTTGCRDDSIMQQIFIASLEPEESRIASGGMSWLGPYFMWMADSITPPNPSMGCCRLDADGNFINSSLSFDPTGVEMCFDSSDFIDNRIQPDLFMLHLRDFLSDNPHETMCPSAGHPAYGDAVNVLEDEDGIEYVGATHYMAYHSILKTSRDFTDALEYVYKLTEHMQKYLRENSEYSPDVEVFPYSIFYVYYEQYLTMWHDTGVSLGISLGSVFGVILLLTFDFVSSFVILTTITMILVDIMGLMYWWDISLNAVSLVNLVMSVGISVEFCSHITHAFAMSVLPTRKERAQEALSKMGTSVLSGITLTKFAGIFVLGFAQSQIFTVFYFRMYLGMVIFGATHGLMFLPVYLSVFGPSVNKVLLKEARKKEELSTLKAERAASDRQNSKLEQQLNEQMQVNRLQQQIIAKQIEQSNAQITAMKRLESQIPQANTSAHPSPTELPTPRYTQIGSYRGVGNDNPSFVADVEKSKF